jgi:hypothetical protein
MQELRPPTADLDRDDATAVEVDTVDVAEPGDSTADADETVEVDASTEDEDAEDNISPTWRPRCPGAAREDAIVLRRRKATVAKPTNDDQHKLDRVFNYLATTKDEVLHFHRGGNVEPEVYVDASFRVHADGSSRSGMIIMVAGVAIGCWSSKQKLVTKLSTEAEVFALSDGLTTRCSTSLWRAIKSVVIFLELRPKFGIKNFC